MTICIITNSFNMSDDIVALNNFYKFAVILKDIFEELITNMSGIVVAKVW